MAIIKCFNCGKQITDRMEKCPHCNIVLLDNNLKKTAKIESTKVSLLGNIVGVVSALILTFCLSVPLNIVTTNQMAAFGDIALIARAISATLFFKWSGCIVLIIGATLFCMVSVFFHKKKVHQLIWGVILTILLGIIGYILQNHIVLNNANLFVKEETLNMILPLAKPNSFSFGFIFPVFLGSLSLMSFGRNIKNTLIMQVLSTICYFFLSCFLAYLILFNFKCEIKSGLYITNALSTIIILGFAVLMNKGFQQLITPPKIS